jgi:hypothetical protein
MFHLSGLQLEGVDPHELERSRWPDATFVMSKRVRHSNNLGGIEISAWDYEMEGSRDKNANGTSEEPAAE